MSTLRRDAATAPRRSPSLPRLSRRILAADPAHLIRWKPLGAGQSSASTLTLPTGRRGVFTIGPLHLWVHDPFGLFALPVATAAPVMLVVHPLCAPSAVR